MLPGLTSQRLQQTRVNVLADRPPVTEQVPKSSIPSGGDPWEDEKWSKLKWTVYRQALAALEYDHNATPSLYCMPVGF